MSVLLLLACGPEARHPKPPVPDDIPTVAAPAPEPTSVPSPEPVDLGTAACTEDPGCLSPAEASFTWRSTRKFASENAYFIGPPDLDYTGDGVNDAVFLFPSTYLGTTAVVAGPLARDLDLPEAAAALFPLAPPAYAGDIDGDAIGDVWIAISGEVGLVHGPLSGTITAQSMPPWEMRVEPTTPLQADAFLFWGFTENDAQLYRGPFPGSLGLPFLTLTPIWGPGFV